MGAVGNIYIFAIVAIVSIAYNISAAPPSSIATTADQLILAQVIYRHGHRAPERGYPTDPYGAESFWPDGFGQLSVTGKQQHYLLGEFFRKRYRALLGDGRYNVDKVYVEASDYDRTVMSAQMNLAALFPPIDEQIWSKRLLWQPIPVHVIPANQDRYLRGSAPCPRWSAIRDMYNAKIVRQYQELFDYISLNSGIVNATYDNIFNFYDTLYVEGDDINQLALPEWTRNVFYPGSPLEMLENEFFRSFTWTPEMSRLTTGIMFKEMLDRCTDKIESRLSPDRVLWFYSAHDITVASMMNLLGVFEFRPPYAAALQFELYRSNEDYYVSLFYRNSTMDNHLLEFPNCGTKCPLEKLYALYANVFPPEDVEAACALDNTPIEYIHIDDDPPN